MSNTKADQIQLQSNSCSVPLSLNPGWNLIQLDMDQITKYIFDTGFKKLECLKINANCKLKRIYTSSKIMGETDLPYEYQTFNKLPNVEPIQELVKRTSFSWAVRNGIESDSFDHKSDETSKMKDDVGFENLVYDFLNDDFKKDFDIEENRLNESTTDFYVIDDAVSIRTPEEDKSSDHMNNSFMPIRKIIHLNRESKSIEIENAQFEPDIVEPPSESLIEASKMINVSSLFDMLNTTLDENMAEPTTDRINEESKMINMSSLFEMVNKTLDDTMTEPTTDRINEEPKMINMSSLFEMVNKHLDDTMTEPTTDRINEESKMINMSSLFEMVNKHLDDSMEKEQLIELMKFLGPEMVDRILDEDNVDETKTDHATNEGIINKE
ncbi:hypothetical protein WDU94_004469 [Cyamophila willieti]